MQTTTVVLGLLVVTLIQLYRGAVARHDRAVKAWTLALRLAERAAAERRQLPAPAPAAPKALPAPTPPRAPKALPPRTTKTRARGRRPAT